jgi:hypothetical protein
VENPNGQTQPPATPESQPTKVAYVISDQVKADIIEDLKERLAQNPELEVHVPTIEELVEAKYSEEVAEKMVIQEQFKADALAELKRRRR